ncbi:MAG: Fur family transcriptional regulator [Planctomycetota bacterium]|jgi:Fur family ferric uptake transcriptional regulator
MTEKTTLKSHKLRVTDYRVSLLRSITELGRPVALEDVSELDCGDKATVYRNLQAFKDAGILRQVKGVGKREIYELNHGHDHAHVVCQGCGKIQCVEADSVAQSVPDGWVMESLSLVVWARCPDCIPTS